MCIELDVLDTFSAMRSLDGKADVAFWGADAEALAREFGARKLNESEFGWTDIPESVVGHHARPIQAAVRDRDLRVGVDYRPHCHVLPLARALGLRA